MAKYKMILGIGYVGAVHEDYITSKQLGFTDEEWELLTEEEKEKELDSCLNEWIWNYIDTGISEVD